LDDSETQHKFTGFVGFRDLNPTYNRIYLVISMSLHATFLDKSTASAVSPFTKRA